MPGRRPPGYSLPLTLWRPVAPPEAPLVLAGARVSLRAPELADYAAWADLRDKSRDFLTPWEPTWPPDDLTREAYRRRLKRYQQDWADGTAYAFFLFARDGGALLGGLTLSNVRRGVAQMATLGYWIGAPFHGQGLMSEAVGLLAAHAFKVLGLHRIEAACVPENEASARVLLKNGFQEEGFARGYLKINGLWRDHRLFAILDATAASV